MNHAHPTIIRPLLRLQGQPLNLPCHYTAAALVALGGSESTGLCTGPYPAPLEMLLRTGLHPLIEHQAPDGPIALVERIHCRLS